MVLAVVVLQERLGPFQYVGALLVIGGVLLLATIGRVNSVPPL